LYVLDDITLSSSLQLFFPGYFFYAIKSQKIVGIAPGI